MTPRTIEQHLAEIEPTLYHEVSTLVGHRLDRATYHWPVHDDMGLGLVGGILAESLTKYLKGDQR